MWTCKVIMNNSNDVKSAMSDDLIYLNYHNDNIEH